MVTLRSRSLFLVSAFLVGCFPLLPAHAQLDLKLIDQSSAYDVSNVWISFDNGGSATPFDVTYQHVSEGLKSVTFGTASGGGANHLTSGILLSDVINQTFTVNSVSSVAVFLSYGESFSVLDASPSFFQNAVSADVRFQNFEITRTGGSGDQGNLTNINYFTAPMKIESFSSTYGGGTTPLQSVGFNKTTAEVASRLGSLSNSNFATKTTPNGEEIIRYIGPSSWTTDPPYPSFIPYLKSITAQNIISNQNAFQTNGATSMTGKNYDFKFNLTSSVSSVDGTITLTGDITTMVKDNATGQITPGETFANADITLSGSDAAKLDSIIYGQTANPFPESVTYGQGWTDFETFINDASNDLTNSGAVGTTKALAIGEVTTAVLMGFLGNTKEVNGVALNSMPSSAWWSMADFEAFSLIQSNPEYYNAWANEIYTASNNGAYSIPYSDRLGTGPLVNTVQYTIGGVTYDVDSWEVSFFDPVAVAVPEPSLLSLVALSGLGLLLYHFRPVRRHQRAS